MLLFVLLLRLLFMFWCWSYLFCGVVLGVLFGLGITLLERASCFVAVCVLCLLPKVPWVGLWYVIVAYSGHTHLLLVVLFCIFHAVVHL